MEGQSKVTVSGPPGWLAGLPLAPERAGSRVAAPRCEPARAYPRGAREPPLLRVGGRGQAARPAPPKEGSSRRPCRTLRLLPGKEKSLTRRRISCPSSGSPGGRALPLPRAAWHPVPGSKHGSQQPWARLPSPGSARATPGVDSAPGPPQAASPSARTPHPGVPHPRPPPRRGRLQVRLLAPPGRVSSRPDPSPYPAIGGAEGRSGARAGSPGRPPASGAEPGSVRPARSLRGPAPPQPAASSAAGRAPARALIGRRPASPASAPSPLATRLGRPTQRRAPIGRASRAPPAPRLARCPPRPRRRRCGRGLGRGAWLAGGVAPARAGARAGGLAGPRLTHAGSARTTRKRVARARGGASGQVSVPDPRLTSAQAPSALSLRLA